MGRPTKHASRSRRRLTKSARGRDGRRHTSGRQPNERPVKAAHPVPARTQVRRSTSSHESHRVGSTDPRRPSAGVDTADGPTLSVSKAVQGAVAVACGDSPVSAPVVPPDRRSDPAPLPFRPRTRLLSEGRCDVLGERYFSRRYERPVITGKVIPLDRIVIVKTLNEMEFA